jgi:hypothetical protein
MVIGVLVMALSVNASFLPYIHLAWDANPEPEVLGYTLYIQESNGSFTWVDDIDETELSNPLLPDWKFQGLQPEDFYYFVLTAYSADNVESDYSNDVCGKLIPGYEHYVECDYKEPTGGSGGGSSGGSGGGGGCFISTLM